MLLIFQLDFILYCTNRTNGMRDREQKRNITNGLLTSWNEFLIASSICFLSIDWNSNFELKMKWKLNNADVTHTRNQFNGIDYCYYCTRLFSLQLKLPAHYHHTGMVFRLTWTCFAYNKWFRLYHVSVCERTYKIVQSNELGSYQCMIFYCSNGRTWKHLIRGNSNRELFACRIRLRGQWLTVAEFQLNFVAAHHRFHVQNIITMIFKRCQLLPTWTNRRNWMHLIWSKTNAVQFNSIAIFCAICTLSIESNWK